MLLDLLYLLFFPFIFLWKCFLETQSIVFVILGIGLIYNLEKNNILSVYNEFL